MYFMGDVENQNLDENTNKARAVKMPRLATRISGRGRGWYVKDNRYPASAPQTMNYRAAFVARLTLAPDLQIRQGIRKQRQ